MVLLLQALKHIFLNFFVEYICSDDFPDCGNETIRLPNFNLITMLHVRSVSNGESEKKL